MSLWKAGQQGTLLPPVSVVLIGDAYALRDGHHRVSVARARGAATIRAVVEAAWPRRVLFDAHLRGVSR